MQNMTQIQQAHKSSQEDLALWFKTIIISFNFMENTSTIYCSRQNRKQLLKESYVGPSD